MNMGASTIYTNHQVEISCINIKQKKVDAMGERPVAKYIQTSWTNWKKKKISPPQNTTLIFWSFHCGMAQTMWFSNRNFRFSLVNGKYPWTLTLYCFLCFSLWTELSTRYEFTQESSSSAKQELDQLKEEIKVMSAQLMRQHNASLDSQVSVQWLYGHLPRLLSALFYNEEYYIWSLLVLVYGSN